MDDVAITRRAAVGMGAGLLALLAGLPRSTVAAAFAAPGPLRFFDDHEAAVVVEATARLIPGPDDDPDEAGHPGAREAGVVHYVDLLLSAFDDDPPGIFAGGPWSDRHGGADNRMAAFVELTSWEEQAWRRRVGRLRDEYRRGVAALDEAAGGDFTLVGPERMDAILAAPGQRSFRRLLFTHAIEGTYAVPEYGGNRGLTGWVEIGYAGDVTPEGWAPEEVSEPTADPAPPDAELPYPFDLPRRRRPVRQLPGSGA